MTLDEELQELEPESSVESEELSDDIMVGANYEDGALVDFFICCFGTMYEANITIDVEMADRLLNFLETRLYHAEN